MKTHQFIDLLSTNVEPVKISIVWKTLALALLLGAIGAFCLMLATVGQRPDLTAPGHVVPVTLKLAFALIVMISAGVALVRLANPGGERLKLGPYFLPILLIFAMGGAIGLDFAISTAGPVFLIGAETWMCITCIPLFAIIPFAALIFVLRKSAPTDLRRAGAMAGLLAGAVGAAIYAFHCPDDSPFFVTVWYGSAMAFCALIGALIGPRLLRW